MIVAQLNKIIISVLLLSTSVFSLEPVVLLSKLNYEKSFKDYEDKISYCSKGDSKAIPLTSLKPLKLTQDQWTTILIHLSRSNFDSCVYDEKANFVMKVNTYIAVSKHFKNDYSDVKHYEGSNYFSNSFSDLEYEIRYLQLSQHIRSYISNIEAFKHPFDVIKTSELLEKSDLIIK